MSTGDVLSIIFKHEIHEIHEKDEKDERVLWMFPPQATGEPGCVSSPEKLTRRRGDAENVREVLKDFFVFFVFKNFFGGLRPRPV